MQTFQLMFFYLFLLNRTDGSLAAFVDMMNLAVGYNKIEQSFSPYEYYAFSDKLFRFGYSKQFILNFNYPAILFGLPLVLLVIRKIVMCKRKRNASLKLRAQRLMI